MSLIDCIEIPKIDSSKYSYPREPSETIRILRVKIWKIFDPQKIEFYCNQRLYRKLKLRWLARGESKIICCDLPLGIRRKSCISTDIAKNLVEGREYDLVFHISQRFYGYQRVMAIDSSRGEYISAVLNATGINRGIPKPIVALIIGYTK